LISGEKHQKLLLHEAAQGAANGIKVRIHYLPSSRDITMYGMELVRGVPQRLLEHLHYGERRRYPWIESKPLR
jgi:hypothetical protein